MLYTSLNNPKIKEIRKLKEKKYRDKEEMFLIEGAHLVEEALKANVLKEVFVLEGYNFSFDGIVNYVSREVMKSLSELPSIPKVIGVCQKQKGKIVGNIVVLDDIQDPGNLGTIIRSSVAFNVKTIILSEKCVDIYSPKVLRAAQGMIFHINIIKEDIVKTLPKLKANGYIICGTKVDAGKEIKLLEKNKKFAIIMGNEGNGVQKDILDLCDEYLYIPMNKACESLNVAVATSIILYELGR